MEEFVIRTIPSTNWKHRNCEQFVNSITWSKNTRITVIHSAHLNDVKINVYKQLYSLTIHQGNKTWKLVMCYVTNNYFQANIVLGVLTINYYDNQIQIKFFYSVHYIITSHKVHEEFNKKKILLMNIWNGQNK